MRRLPIVAQLAGMFLVAISFMLLLLGFVAYQYTKASDTYENLITHTSVNMLLLTKAQDGIIRGLPTCAALWPIQLAAMSSKPERNLRIANKS